MYENLVNSLMVNGLNHLVETYDVINPATEELIGKASKANKKDIDACLEFKKD